MMKEILLYVLLVKDDYTYSYLPSDDSGLADIQTCGEAELEKSLMSSGEHSPNETSALRKRV